MKRYLSRLGLGLAMCLASGVIAVVGVAFLLAAFYLTIRNVSSPATAALASGALALVVAGVIALIAKFTIGRKAVSVTKTGTAQAGGNQAELAAELGQILGAEMTSRIRTHPKEAALLAVVAGFVVGASPGLRGALRSVFKQSD